MVKFIYQVELQQIKQEIDRKMAEKDEEIDNARRNAVRSLEQIQGMLKSHISFTLFPEKIINNSKSVFGQ